MQFGKMAAGRWAMATALCGLLGCGVTHGGAAPDETALVRGPDGRSGERLTAKAYGAGEAVQFRHFYDESLGFDCQFGLDDAGTPRCFPRREEQVVYLDAQCREPALRQEGLEAGHWLVARRQDGDVPCAGDLESHPEAFVVGEQVYAASPIGQEDYELFASDDGGCSPGADTGRTGGPVHRLVRKPASVLAPGRVETLQTSEGLRIDRVFAEDGAEANLGARLEDGTACYLQRDGSCMAVSETHPTGAACALASTRVGSSGGELRDVGSGPLHLEVYEFSSAAGSLRLQALDVGEFLTSRGTSCSVAQASDGTLRCVDEQDEVEESGYFADDTCEMRLYTPKDKSIEGSADPRLAELYWIERGAGWRIEKLHRPQPGRRGPLYEVVQNQCQQAQTLGPSVLLWLSGELSFDVLPEVEDTRLP